MKSKAIVFLAAVSLLAGLHAAPEEKKTRRVHTLVIREHWIPDYVVNSTGFLVPGAPKAFEVPPDNLAIHDNSESDLLDLRYNIIGPAIKVDSEKIHLGILEKKPVADKPAKSSPPAKGGESSKNNPSFKPLIALGLPGGDNLVCLYPRPKNDWRGINHLVVGLDALKPGDEKLLVINVSAFPLVVRSGDGNPATVPPAAYVFIRRRVKDGNKMRIQAAALIAGRQKIAANTTVTIVPDKIPVLTFTNADPESGNCGVDFLKDAVDYPPSPEAAAGDKPVAIK